MPGPSQVSNVSADRVVIRCEGLEKQFGGVQAVAGVDLEVRRGRTLALIGPSGCGKTTTLRLIAGFERPDGGTIDLAGQVVVGPGRFVPPEKRGVGMVFQDYALFPHLDVARNVGFGLPAGPGRASRVAEVLELVGLAGLENRSPHELSGGQQQRVALARALAPAPALLLLDEPFSNLDATLRTRVRQDIADILLRASATTIFVTHDQDEALSLADEVAVMHQGRVLQIGSPEEVYRRPAYQQVALLLGEANLLAGRVMNGEVETEIGRLPTDSTDSGPVTVAIRPESLGIERARTAEEGTAEVVRREYFGHDQRLSVRLLATDRVLSIRLGPEPSLQVGDRVCVRITGAVSVFPAEKTWPNS